MLFTERRVSHPLLDVEGYSVVGNESRILSHPSVSGYEQGMMRELISNGRKRDKIISHPVVGYINQEVVRVCESGVDRERREYEDHGRTEGIFWTSGGDEGRRTELTERTELWGVRGTRWSTTKGGRTKW